MNTLEQANQILKDRAAESAKREKEREAEIISAAKKKADEELNKILKQKEKKLEADAIKKAKDDVSKDIKGGRLLFEDGLILEPRFNRLVIFSPGLLHGVEPFRGKRTSININPWKHEIHGWTRDYEGSTE